MGYLKVWITFLLRKEMIRQGFKTEHYMSDPDRPDFLLFLILVVLSAIFSGTETALASLNKGAIHKISSKDGSGPDLCPFGRNNRSGLPPR